LLSRSQFAGIARNSYAFILDVFDLAAEQIQQSFDANSA
jgi:hypothetical protein